MRGIDTSAAVLPFRKADENLPDAGRLITALRQIGYSLEQAIADLVDNSINAGADTVLIRFLHDSDSITGVAVADNGSGMDDGELENAMRFGSSEAAEVGSLGKFGMGLKLASLSHAQTLNVLATGNGSAGGRRWTLEGIQRGWWCERIHADTASELLSRKWGPMDLSQGGTLVLWEDLDKLPSHRNGLKYTLTSLENRLRLHLGLCFHRFLESGKLTILVDQLIEARVGQGMSASISPLNPFGYGFSGHSDYPKQMTVALSGIGELELEAHIWPAKSEAPEYRLGRRSAARQGFYFYRNGRLIQAGGWNGLVQDETEPHSSLARIKIDLPVSYDEDFGINVQKSTVLVPPVFPEILDALADDGTSFEQFRRDAIECYRSANTSGSNIGNFPAKGLPKPVLVELAKLYARNGQDGFSIRWLKLEDDEFFRIEPDRKRIVLNRKFKVAGSENIVGFLIASLLRTDVKDGRKAGRKKELDAINRILIGLGDS